MHFESRSISARFSIFLQGFYFIIPCFFIIILRWQSITWSMPHLTQTVSYPALRRYSWLRPLHVFRNEPPLDIKGISAYRSPAYPCRKDWKGLVRIYSQSRLFSFLTKAAQAVLWISSWSPKLKREQQQPVAGTNEAFAEFVRSSFRLSFLRKTYLTKWSDIGKEEPVPWQIHLSKGQILLWRKA